MGEKKSQKYKTIKCQNVKLPYLAKKKEVLEPYTVFFVLNFNQGGSTD